MFQNLCTIECEIKKHFDSYCTYWLWIDNVLSRHPFRFTCPKKGTSTLYVFLELRLLDIQYHEKVIWIQWFVRFTDRKKFFVHESKLDRSMAKKCHQLSGWMLIVIIWINEQHSTPKNAELRLISHQNTWWHVKVTLSEWICC